MNHKDNVWKKLIERQKERALSHASERFIMYYDEDFDSVCPTLEALDAKLRPTGWKVVKASERYLSDEKWFDHLSKKEWPISNFLRKEKNLQFTPLPDMFHDVFGHFSFLFDSEYMEVVELFTASFNRAEGVKRKRIGRVWWHTIEFGLIQEQEETKALGAGLLSSVDEIEKAVVKQNQQQFDFHTVANTPKARAETHNGFFVLDSFEQLRTVAQVLVEATSSDISTKQLLQRSPTVASTL